LERSKIRPGLRAQFDPNYMAPAMAQLKRILTEIFGLSDGVVLRECCASIVTCRPQDLSESQSIPHIDGADPMKIAAGQAFIVTAKPALKPLRRTEKGCMIWR